MDQKTNTPDSIVLAMGQSRRQTGASLLEILVALTIVSIGLLGLAGMQANGVRNNAGAFLRSQAMQFAYDMTDRMRANRSAARSGSYNLSISDDAPAGATVPDVDRAQWLADLATLPSGDGAISVDNNGKLTITVQWHDRRAAVGQNEQIVVETQL